MMLLLTRCDKIFRFHVRRSQGHVHIRYVGQIRLIVGLHHLPLFRALFPPIKYPAWDYRVYRQEYQQGYQPFGNVTPQQHICNRPV